MADIHYIHAADLHLDSPFRNLDRSNLFNNQLGNLVKDATNSALERLVGVCESFQPDFMLLTGDLYDANNHNLKAQLNLAQFCIKLESLNLPIFIALGSHAPLDSLYKEITWPQNVTIFGAEPESHVLKKNGGPLAVIHGISRSSNTDQRNFASLLHKDNNYNCFQIGAFECPSDIFQANPGFIDELRHTGLDALALSNASEHKFICEQPFIAYAGSTQGLNKTETGPRGCLEISVSRSQDLWSCQPVFKQLASLQWEDILFEPRKEIKQAETEQILGDKLDDLRASVDTNVAGIIATILLKIESSFPDVNYSPHDFQFLIDGLKRYALLHPAVWIRSIDFIQDNILENNISRPDLLGETARLAAEILKDKSGLISLGKHVSKDLYKNPLCEKYVPSPNEQMLEEMLLEAESLCQRRLEIL